MPKKVVQFFLKCDPAARYFYSVEFHPTKQSMLRAVKRLQGTARHAQDSRAICLRFTLKNPDPNYEQIGTMYFVRSDASADVVVHELTHAACGWARKEGLQPINGWKKIRYADDPEERFACTMQYFVQQFYSQAPALLAAST